MSNWLGHVLGLDNGSGHWYLFWSGFGANFQEFAIVGVAYGAYRKHSCHEPRCWRLGVRATYSGSTKIVCHKHHRLGG